MKAFKIIVPAISFIVLITDLILNFGDIKTRYFFHGSNQSSNVSEASGSDQGDPANSTNQSIEEQIVSVALITNEFANVRSEPSMNSEMLSQVFQGEEYVLTGNEDPRSGYTEIYLDDERTKTGWVNSQWFEKKEIVESVAVETTVEDEPAEEEEIISIHSSNAVKDPEIRGMNRNELSNYVSNCYFSYDRKDYKNGFDIGWVTRLLFVLLIVFVLWVRKPETFSRPIIFLIVYLVLIFAVGPNKTKGEYIYKNYVTVTNIEYDSRNEEYTITCVNDKGKEKELTVDINKTEILEFYSEGETVYLYVYQYKYTGFRNWFLKRGPVSRLAYVLY